MWVSVLVASAWLCNAKYLSTMGRQPTAECSLNSLQQKFFHRDSPSTQLASLMMALGRRSVLSNVAAVAVTGQVLPAAAVGPSSLSGKPRPETGVILLDAPTQAGGVNSAEVICDDGVLATVAFDSGMKLSTGAFSDFEVTNEERDGRDSIYLHVAAMPEGASFDTVPLEFIEDALFSEVGRFSAYGAPSSVQFKDKGTEGSLRVLEGTFSVLTALGTDIDRHAVISVAQPKGSSDILMLVGSTSVARWQKMRSALRDAVRSFRVVSARSTKLTRTFASDYRYASSGTAELRARASKAGPVPGR